MKSFPSRMTSAIPLRAVAVTEALAADREFRRALTGAGPGVRLDGPHHGRIALPAPPRSPEEALIEHYLCILALDLGAGLDPELELQVLLFDMRSDGRVQGIRCSIPDGIELSPAKTGWPEVAACRAAASRTFVVVMNCQDEARRGDSWPAGAPPSQPGSVIAYPIAVPQSASAPVTLVLCAFVDRNGYFADQAGAVMLGAIAHRIALAEELRISSETQATAQAAVS